MNEQNNWKKTAAETAIEAHKNKNHYAIFSEIIYQGFQKALSSQAQQIKEKMKVKIKDMKIMRKHVTDQGIVMMKEQGCKRNTTLNDLLSAIESIEI